MLGSVMDTTQWLRRQVAKLEDEIRRSAVFDDDLPASKHQLDDLRRLVVVRTYLRQQLLRRETVTDADEYDTRELVEIRRAQRRAFEE